MLIRIYIASGYFSSGMCKLLCGLRFNRYWGKGPTLQMYIYDSMWSRPAGPAVRKLQHLMLTHPYLLTLLATGSVVFETCFILAPTSDVLCVIFGINGFLFHNAIGLLQGLDFVTFWTPALLVFLVGVPSREPWTAIFTGLEHETGFFLPAVIYTLLQVRSSARERAFAAGYGGGDSHARRLRWRSHRFLRRSPCATFGSTTFCLSVVAQCSCSRAIRLTSGPSGGP